MRNYGLHGDRVNYEHARVLTERIKACGIDIGSWSRTKEDESVLTFDDDGANFGRLYSAVRQAWVGQRRNGDLVADVYVNLYTIEDAGRGSDWIVKAVGPKGDCFSITPDAFGETIEGMVPALVRALELANPLSTVDGVAKALGIESNDVLAEGVARLVSEYSATIQFSSDADKARFNKALTDLGIEASADPMGDGITLYKVF